MKFVHFLLSLLAVASSSLWASDRFLKPSELDCNAIATSRGSSKMQEEILSLEEFVEFIDYHRWGSIRPPKVQLERDYNGWRNGTPNQDRIEHKEEHLDLDGIGFAKSNLVSRERVFTLLNNPFLDPAEIRLRQEAISEIVGKHDSREIYEGLNQIFQSQSSKVWRSTLFQEGIRPAWFTRDQYYDEQSIYHILNLPASELNQWLLDAKKKAYIENSLASVDHFLSGANALFVEIEQISSILQTARSARLQRLKFLLSAISSKEHPYSVAHWVEQYQKAEPLTRLRMLIAEKNTFSNMTLLLLAYSELAMYYDIAHHALQSNWTHFPKIVNQDPARGPVLKVENLHSPRVHRATPERSVPNTIHLGVNESKNIIITGPNAQGKSTLLRSIAQFVVLSQMGSPVPADYAELTPMRLLPYIHPTDNPRNAESLFMAEGKTLWNTIYTRSSRNPFTLVLMDEILPGTISEVREASEIAFLEALTQTGVLSITATHSWGTTELGKSMKQHFRNFHVEHYRLREGPVSSISSMYEGAVEALKKVGWPDSVLKRVRHMAKKSEQ